ncbi:MAG: imidazoleglycerol-phosphate dehydratase [Gemmatimonadota bacterium]
MTEVVRETRETSIRVALALGGATHDIRTSVPFLDHMLVTLGRYAAVGLTVEARGDLRHHLIEDVAIAVGTVVRGALPNECARYGNALVPMDDALVQLALDLGGRHYYRGPLPSSLYDHWMRSFAEHARCTLHIRVLRGRDRHHIVEAGFKALGFALREALKPAGEIMSTKGAVSLRESC